MSIIKIIKKDNLNIEIDSDGNWDYLRAVKEHFSHYTEGYKFNNLYRTGRWDGKVSLFNSMNRTIPYGLFLEWMKFHKKEYPEIEISVSEEIKSLFRGIDPVYTKDLIYKPYDYQDDCIKSMLKTSKGICRVATAGGKSCIISYVLKGLMENNQLDRALLIVPSVSLVAQFYSDMTDYGMDMSIVGRVGDTWKEWDNKIVISTWQSLQNVPEKMSEFNVVIVDEVHSVRGQVLRDLMAQAINATFRYGVTGTLPDSDLETLQVMSYIGPVLREYGSVKLAKMGYVSKCNIKVIHVDYNTKPKGDYNEVKNIVFNNSYRLGLITEIVRKCDASVLLLVGKVEDEGVVLRNHLESQGVLGDREICFLSGKDNAKEREIWRKYTDEQKHIVLVATYGIFSTGINIKSLRYLILASPFKSKIRVLQSIGRTLRLHCDKINGATVWDVCDSTKYLREHGDIRMKHYAKEGFDIEEIFMAEQQLLPDELFKV